MSFKSGFVTIIGRPNAGKSTLVNGIMGEKISIMSSKPQTTRNTIRAIFTDESCQIIFVDTPGIHTPKTKLGEYMVQVATETVNEADVCLFIVEATHQGPGEIEQQIIEQLQKTKTPVILVVNKIDLIEKPLILPIIKSYSELMNFKAIIPISALKKDGIGFVIDEIKKYLEEGPMYFPDDISTDQPERVMAAEIIREKILLYTNDEVPHGTGVEVISFKSRPKGKIIDIEADIFCEKSSHKAILIGKQGSMLKKIGSSARQEIENLLGTKVNLQLFVKVRDDWRNSNTVLKTLGYDRK